jgi:hypothetical protein
MSLEVWFRTDVTRVLNAAQEAMDSIPNIEDKDMRNFRAGYEAALRVIASSFGIVICVNQSESPRLTGE